MKLATVILLLFSLTGVSQDLGVPKTIDPPPQAQAPRQVECLPQIGKVESYYLDHNVAIDIRRDFTRRPENNCADDPTGSIKKPVYSSEREASENGFAVITQVWQFSPSGEVRIVRPAEGNAFPDVQKTLDLSAIIRTVVGSRMPNGDEGKDLTGYGPWQIESDRTFEYGNTDWLHAREVVFVRNPPPSPPRGPGQYRIIADPIYLRYRRIVDSCNKQEYVLINTGSSDRWFDSLRIHCDDLSNRSDK